MLWLQAAAKAGIEACKPDLTQEMGVFVNNPQQDTFETALKARFPYYFPNQSMGKGRALFANLPFPFQSAVWCQKNL